MPIEILSTMHAWRKHRETWKRYHPSFSPSCDPPFTYLTQIWEEIPILATPPTGFLVKMLASGVGRSDHNLLTNEKQPPGSSKNSLSATEVVVLSLLYATWYRKIPGSRLGQDSALRGSGCGGEDYLKCSRDLVQLC